MRPGSLYIREMCRATNRNNAGHLGVYSRCAMTSRALRASTVLALMFLMPAVGWTQAFDRDTLVVFAQRLAEKSYQPVETTLPSELANVDFDTYRTFRYRKEARLLTGKDSRFSIDLLAPGFLYRTPVEIFLVNGGVAEIISFDAGRFEFGEFESVARNSSGMFYSGFRIRFPINRPDLHDEVVVFQGASYFRAVGRGNIYGLSARGLAINTADPAGEEFPHFKRFWIEQPKPFASSITVHALLDSKSVAGAYTFVITPGVATTVDVETTLFPRVDIDNIGIAALTSMFYFDASNRVQFDDHRNAVHDSNGLQMVTGTGDRLWRALANPRRVRLSAFSDNMPGGFGLVQRSRRFRDFEDAEANYEKRPSAWVEPTDEWGPGSVILIEIPTDTEYNDNIVAFWRPEAPLRANKRQTFRYRLHWSDLPGDDVPLARVIATRSGRTTVGEGRHFVIDFVADGLGDVPLADVSNSAGRVSNVTMQRIAGEERLRVSFDLYPDDAQLIELGVSLKNAERILSERWLYQWTPQN